MASVVVASIAALGSEVQDLAALVADVDRWRSWTSAMGFERTPRGPKIHLPIGRGREIEALITPAADGSGGWSAAALSPMVLSLRFVVRKKAATGTISLQFEMEGALSGLLAKPSGSVLEGILRDFACDLSAAAGRAPR